MSAASSSAAAQPPRAFVTLFDEDGMLLEDAGETVACMGIEAASLTPDLRAIVDQRHVVIVTPMGNVDEAIDVPAAIRRAVHAISPHASSTSVSFPVFYSPDEAIEQAVPADKWLKVWGRKPLGRWEPTFLDEAEPPLHGEWLVKGLLPGRGVAVLFGESGSGKTFLALDIAFHIAEGECWRGLRTERRGVMWVAAEAPQGMRKRLFALRLRKPFPQRRTPFAMFSVAPDLRTSPKDTGELVEAIKQVAVDMDEPVGLIVVDTLSQVLNGGSDIAMEDLGAVLANVGALGHEIGALVLIVHHSGHSEKNRMRGHSSFHAACDAVIGVKVTPGTKLRTAWLDKLKDGECGGVWHFELEQVQLGKDPDGDEISTCIIRHRDDLHLPDATRNQQQRASVPQADVNADLVLSIARKLAATTHDVPAGVREALSGTLIVPRDRVRSEAFAAGFACEASEGARKKAFQRAISRLCHNHEIEEREGWLCLDPQ